MKLFLMRHAEAKESKEMEDIFRELTSRGINQAKKAAQSLEKSGIDKILVSSSKRTVQTAKIIQEKLGTCELEASPELYASNPDIILKNIYAQDSNYKNILVIAHNPGIFHLALDLTKVNPTDNDTLIEKGMPTANIIILDFLELKHWSDLNSYTKVRLHKNHLNSSKDSYEGEA